MAGYGGGNLPGNGSGESHDGDSLPGQGATRRGGHESLPGYGSNGGVKAPDEQKNGTDIGPAK